MEDDKQEAEALASNIDLDPLEQDIAKMGLFIMNLDAALGMMPQTRINDKARFKFQELRAMMVGQKTALRAELRQHETPDS